jgi:hypothetical protein
MKLTKLFLLIGVFFFLADAYGQNQSLRVDIDKNGKIDVFNYDDSKIFIQLNGKKFVRRIDDFGNFLISQFMVKNGVFSFTVDCEGHCSGQYSYTYHWKVIRDKLQLISYEARYRSISCQSPCLVHNSFDLLSKDYIFKHVEESGDKEKIKKGKFEIKPLFFDSCQHDYYFPIFGNSDKWKHN